MISPFLFHGELINPFQTDCQTFNPLQMKEILVTEVSNNSHQIERDLCTAVRFKQNINLNHNLGVSPQFKNIVSLTMSSAQIFFSNCYKTFTTK